MITALLTSLEPADRFSRLIIEMGWKSTLILGCAVLLGELLKRRSASLRRTVYTAGILTMLCFVVIAPLSPRWRINTPGWFPAFGSEKTTLATGPEIRGFQSAGGNSGTGIDSSNKNKPGGDHLISPAVATLPFIWLTITLFLLGKLTANLFTLKHLRLTSSHRIDEPTNRLVHEIGGKLGYEKQPVTILRNELIEMPVTWGVLRHFILVPKDFEQLPAEDCRLILLHELAHVKRHDFVYRIFADVLCAVLWFQPLAWAARKNLKEAQERAADDCVLVMGEKASGYAKLLLEWSGRLSGKALIVVPGVAGQKSLKSRLEAILNPDTHRRPMTAAEVSAIFLILLGLAIPLAGMGISHGVHQPAGRNSFEPSKPRDGNQKAANVSGPSELTRRAVVSEAKAVEIATNFQPGTVLESEFGQSGEGIVYKILIRNEDSARGDVTRLTINALDGRIIKTWRGIRR